MSKIDWTHPSVVRLFDEGVTDPFAWVEQRAREVALRAMEEGWAGPPYDSFELADLLGIEVVARQDLDDARLVDAGGQPRIEFNPQRRPARVRFSIAHEIGHKLFTDYADRTRYRDMEERRNDDWQLEVLCNVAAAEFLMPAGSLPLSEAADLDLVRLLDQRQRFGVSTEALLRRVVRLTKRSATLFAAARTGAGRFRIDYTVGSRRWKSPVATGDEIGSEVLARCTAVGYADHGVESWRDEDLHVQAVGVPPYPGDTFPRVIGLVQPPHEVPDGRFEIRYVRGNAAEPRGQGAAVIAHVVNDQAQRWGGRGFVRSLMDRYPDAAENYASWPRSQRELGAVHLQEAAQDTWIASMVAQFGYGQPTGGKPRLRLSALRVALETVADQAAQLHAEVHMPLIGTGQGGMAWPKVRDLILEELCARGLRVTVYVLPDAAMPDEADQEDQLALL